MDIRWLGLTDNTKSIARVDSAMKEFGSSIQWFTDEDRFRMELEEVEHAVVFLKSSPSYDMYDLCRGFTLFYPLVCTVLLVPEDELDLKKAMRVGAVDVIRLSSREAEIIDAIREAEKTVQLKSSRVNNKEEKKEYARVITVCSTKGGVGKSTTAVNLATAFSKRLFHVAILDLDLQFGDISIMFDVKPKRTIYDWVNEEYTMARNYMDRLVITHEDSGVDIVPSPLRPEFAEVIKGEHIEELIRQLREKYDVVVIDTSPVLLEPGLIALENSRDILLVVTRDLPTLKNSRLHIETMESLGLTDKVRLVLNRDSRAKGLKIETCEEILQRPIYARIPDDEKVVSTSVNQGVPFVLSNPRTAVSKSIFTLAEQLHPVEPGKRNEKPSKLKKFFKSGRRVSCHF